MQNDTSKFVRNIIPLQNIQSNVSAVNSVSVLANNVANLQSMVNYDTKTINADFIQSYTVDGTIQFTSPINLCNVGITTNGETTTTGVAATDTQIDFLVNNRQVMTIAGSGNLLYYDVSGLATEFRISSVVLKADSAAFSTITTGTCYAQNFVTLSDRLKKTNIREWRDTTLDKFSNICPYAFTYNNESVINVGLLAQEVATVFPECVKGGDEGMYVNYDSIVALLVRAVRELTDRVALLEGHRAEKC